MHMMRSCAVLLIALLLPSLALAESAPERYAAFARGTLVIEPDGSVGEVTLDPLLADAQQAALIAQIRNWKFRPIIENGVAIRARGHMALELIAEGTANGDGLQLSINDVNFTDPPEQAAQRGEKRVLVPRMSAETVRRGIGGRIVVAVETDASGQVQRAAVRAGSLHVRASDVSSHQRQRAFEDLSRLSLRVVRQWTFPDCTGICEVPITYTIDRVDRPRTWRPLLDMPVTPEPWVLAADAILPLSAEGTALSSRFQPVDPVTGPLAN
jgi:hypothetical protein